MQWLYEMYQEQQKKKKKKKKGGIVDNILYTFNTNAVCFHQNNIPGCSWITNHDLNFQ